MNKLRIWTLTGVALATAACFLACGGDENGDGSGNPSTGGAGGSSAGGSSSGGTASGGTASGGTASGGTASGGTTAGGTGGTTGGNAGTGGSTGGTGGGGAGGGSGIPGTDNFDCSPAEGEPPNLELVQVVTGLNRPVGFIPVPGTTDTFVAVEQHGMLQLVKAGVVQETEYLDIQGRVLGNDDGQSEQGLLSLAFHPNFESNQKLYVYYTVQDGHEGLDGGDSLISEFTLSSNPDVVDDTSERPILPLGQPDWNHNGGTLLFGPGGYLYLAYGDGGDSSDTAQDTSSMLGSIIRIDVNATDAGEYGIPAGNLTGDGVAPEIFHWGLRNPWRMSFDGCTADLYIGDVGSSGPGVREEINVAPAGSSLLNFGWPTMEGTSCSSGGCDMTNLALPIANYDHSGGNAAVSGGYVYRGSSIPGLRGTYFYADYSSGRFYALEYSAGSTENIREISSDINPTAIGSISSFAQDFNGEVYVVSFNGNVYRIEAE